MSFPFDKHEEGCRPLARCRNCQIADFLSAKLSPADLTSLASLMREGPAAAPLDSQIRDAMNLPVRAENALRNGEIYTLDDLVRKSRHELLRMPNFGPHSLRQVEDELERLGHRLEELPPK